MLLAWAVMPLAQGQEASTSVFPNRSLSFYVGTMAVFHNVGSINWEHYRHSTDDSHHWGLGYGVSVGYGWWAGLSGSAHIHGMYWSGRKKDHFEARLGLAPTYFTGTGNASERFFPVPILTLGYRRQAPGSNNYFCVHAGSTGIGLGFGKSLDQE